MSSIPPSIARYVAKLSSMSSFLVDAFSGLPTALHAAPGPNGQFSPVEHAWHLADLEELGFAERIRRLRVELNPQLADFAGDEVARERNYKARSLTEGIAAFTTSRTKNLEALNELDTDEWSRCGRQFGVGPITLADLPAMMDQHDDSHRQEIEAWINDVASTT